MGGIFDLSINDGGLEKIAHSELLTKNLLIREMIRSNESVYISSMAKRKIFYQITKTMNQAEITEQETVYIFFVLFFCGKVKHLNFIKAFNKHRLYVELARINYHRSIAKHQQNMTVV